MKTLLPLWILITVLLVSACSEVHEQGKIELLPQPISPIHTPAPIPTAVIAAPAPRMSGYAGPYDPSGPDWDCPDFTTPAETQAFFVAVGGPAADPHRLDGDNDGLVCERNS
jgi:hypothetical protein